VAARLRLAQQSPPELARPLLRAVLRSDPRNARALALLARLENGPAAVALCLRSAASQTAPALELLPTDFTALDDQ
jgi:cytochrome c-type biogenesis protein CcmH/NrfG